MNTELSALPTREAVLKVRATSTVINSRINNCPCWRFFFFSFQDFFFLFISALLFFIWAENNSLAVWVPIWLSQCLHTWRFSWLKPHTHKYYATRWKHISVLISVTKKKGKLVQTQMVGGGGETDTVFVTIENDKKQYGQTYVTTPTAKIQTCLRTALLELDAKMVNCH